MSINFFKNFKLSNYMIVALILTILLFAGCSNKPAENSVSNESSNENSSKVVTTGGILKIGLGPLSGDIKNLGYVGSFRGANEYLAAGTSLETLVRLNKNGEIVPWLAESWTVDADSNTITFKLKEGVKFHDGTDFNAEAVKWNIDQAIVAKSVEFSDVESVDIVDDFNVQVNLKKWNNSMLGTFATYMTMFSPTAAEENGGKEWMMKNLVGTGPFKFVSLENDVSIKFEKFNEYWQPGKPNLDAVEFYMYQDEMSLAASFQAEEIDVIFAPTLKTASSMESVGKVVELKSGMGSSMTGVITNSKDPDSPFHDVRVRKALGHAIDPKSILNAVTFGFAVQTNQYGTSDFWSYNPEVEGTSYNPELAKKLLAEAGYPDGFKTTLYTDASYMDVMTAVQGFLSQIGIEANIDLAEPSRMQQMVSPNGTWDGIMVFNPRVEPDVALYMPRYFSEDAVRFGKNILHPEKITTLFSEAKSAKDQDEKAKIAKELQKAIFDEYALVTPFWLITMPSVLSNKVVDSGINETHATGWTPEEVRIQQ
ncbi:ABC transporter substrate-binding protein [Bacillus sp. Marseille-P3661]|uniref:ABC transporter substrate-binding protein n=1 Tax=Bacillus sp. Marseille-P3661 TaxID=1936234 RepID=UPI0015E169A1|nr:ABC transporter substrate-binding protein [Bacillus sp. Marseille-P3661]